MFRLGYMTIIIIKLSGVSNARILCSIHLTISYANKTNVEYATVKDSAREEAND